MHDTISQAILFVQVVLSNTIEGIDNIYSTTYFIYINPKKPFL